MARRQVTAARATVRVLRELGRLEPVDDALVTAFLGLAAAVDSKPQDASLWREYRAAEAALRGVGTGDDPDAVQAFLRYLNGDDAGPPEVRDTAEP